MTIVEFFDFQCPSCRVAAADLVDLRRWYGNRLAVVYRHLPFKRNSRSAALAAECASRMGKFEDYHDVLYAQSDSIGTKSWTTFATEIGISDTTAFSSCMMEPSVAAAVDRDSSAAMALGARVTPTFLINDLLVSGNIGLTQLNEFVKAALREPAR